METKIIWEKRANGENTPILPMRYGNNVSGAVMIKVGKNSDPTYETWKLRFHTSISLSSFFANSDPTYEAWKLEQRSKQRTHELYSDPTYEVWKLQN